MIDILQLQQDLEVADDSPSSTYQQYGMQMEENGNVKEALSTLNSEESRRWKRKVIFGGGNYGHTGRRGGVVGGGDPWGRRKGHYNPGRGLYDALPFPRQNAPSVQEPTGTTSHSPITTLRSDYVLITTTSPPIVSPPTSAKVTHEAEDSVEGDSVKRQSNKKMGRAGRKLTRNVKLEIAKYAIQYGTDQAANRYENILGQRLPLKRIEKFVKKYQRHQKKARGDHS